MKVVKHKITWVMVCLVGNKEEEIKPKIEWKFANWEGWNGHRKREREIRTRFKVFLSFLQDIRGERENEMLSNNVEKRCNRMGICRSYVSQAEISINIAITFHIIEIGRRIILKRV